MASAITAIDVIGEHYAIFLYPHGMTYVDGGFLG